MREADSTTLNYPLALPVDVSGLMEQGEFHFGIVSATGIVLKDDISEATWLELAKNALGLWERLKEKHLTMSMKVADILNWGEEHLGEKYAQAIDLTRKSLIQESSTVEEWQRVFKKVEPSRRRENLTYSHHQAVAALLPGEQDEFLKKAEDEGLTVTGMKALIKERHPKPERASKKSVKTLDDEKTIAQKLIDCSNWLKANSPTEKMKRPLADCHLAFRRKWQSGRKK